MRRLIGSPALAVWAVFLGCAAGGYETKAPAEGMMARTVSATYADDGFAADAEGKAAGQWGGDDGEALGGSGRPSPATAGRKMIYTARFGLLVPAIEDAVARLLRQVEESGGYLKERDDGTVVCKVPVARFFPLLDRVRELGVVVSEALDAKDVTREMQDLEIRLDNARRSRTRLLALLERATVVEDILKIENELRRLTEEIEQMEGALRLMTHQVEFSTLTVRFTSNAPEVRTRRGESRFPWVRTIGVERVLEDF